MLKIVALDHIVLRTAQLPQMIDFYTRVLGCTLERETEPSLGLTQLRAGNALIDLVTVDSELGRVGGGAPTATENNLDHFCLQLEPLAPEQLSAWLSGQGVAVSEFEQRYGAEGFGSSIYISDPDGNRVELRCRLAPA